MITLIPQMDRDMFTRQATAYPATGPAGIDYFAGETAWGTVDCLLYRTDDGQLAGILNHYPTDIGPERAGNVNIFVHPEHFRQGIGSALLREAMSRWEIDLEQQVYTPDGLGLVTGLGLRPARRSGSRHTLTTARSGS